jgi:hypothetical protein
MRISYYRRPHTVIGTAHRPQKVGRPWDIVIVTPTQKLRHDSPALDT